MTKQTLGLGTDLYNYLLGNSLREVEILRELRQETAKLPMSMMQISPEQGQFMALLIKILGAKKDFRYRSIHWLQFPGSGFVFT